MLVLEKCLRMSNSPRIWPIQETRVHLISCQLSELLTNEYEQGSFRQIGTECGMQVIEDSEVWSGLCTVNREVLPCAPNGVGEPH